MGPIGARAFYRAVELSRDRKRFSSLSRSGVAYNLPEGHGARLNVTRKSVARGSTQGCIRVCSRLLMAALAGWVVLVATELVLLFVALRLFAMLLGPELLPSLKAVLDMAALAACGWIAGRLGRPRVIAAATLTAAGLTMF